MQWDSEPALALQEECAELALCLHGFDARARMVRAQCRALAGDFWGAQEDYLSLNCKQVGAALHIVISPMWLGYASS